MSEIEYLPAKTLVSPTKDYSWFGTSYNMNIYRGCSHGCIYCDSRSECYRDDTFYKVKVKKDALNIVERDIKDKQIKGVVGSGSMSDPYNPLEKKLELTRGALELFDRYGFGVALTTKSASVLRDTDLLKRISSHSPVTVMITITTGDDGLARLIEPGADSCGERFTALKTLAENGIFCGILLMPVLPFITDDSEGVARLIERAKDAHVAFIYPSFGMTLRDRQRDYYYKKLDELFPGLKARYQKTYRNAYSCRSPNAKALACQLKAAADRAGILHKMADIIRAYQVPYRKEQLRLF